jgi:hypothetical protein
LHNHSPGRGARNIGAPIAKKSRKQRVDIVLCGARTTRKRDEVHFSRSLSFS